MCGFAGELARRRACDVDAVERMAQTLAPRGPDGSGSWSAGPAAVAHRRLKVIDLSERGAQPLVDPDNDMTVVFNGCIYNHRELRAELEDDGYVFFSDSDTEVVAKAWRRWGPACVQRLLGMFAFAVIEADGERVTLVRDRLGIKPLYLAEVDGGTRFASTLPALLAGGGIDTALDPVALHHYFSWHGVVPAPMTVLQGVRKLPPATILVLDDDGTQHSTTYWSPSFTRRAEDLQMTAGDWSAAILDALRTAVRRRMVADVPVGVLLSGGLDSSIIVALLAEAGQTDLGTFSVGFDDAGTQDGDEFAFSDRVAQQFSTDHHRWRVDTTAIVDALPAAISAMSEPMVSHDAIGFYLLAEQVARTHKVVQCGQGADEIFAGYSWYPPMQEARGLGADAYAREFFDRPHAEMADLLTDAMIGTEDPSTAWVQEHFGRPGADTPVDRALRLDTQTMLVDDPVKRVDNMTMAWGLEARTPFLDHELVELAAACPPQHKLAGGGKGVLKQACRGLLPDEIIDRRKGYFPVPALSHLEEPVLGLVCDALHSERARSRGVLRPEYVARMLAAPNDHHTTLEGSKLWQVGLLELWLQEHGL